MGSPLNPSGLSRYHLRVEKLINLYNARFRIVWGLAFLGLVFLAWYNRFIQDDAFISFRYARNLVEGNGLVWNPGERVEGYTNFLWTLMIAGGIKLGLDPVMFSQILGLICFALTLVFTYKLARLIFGRDLAVLTIILLGTNYSFSAYATGGLETQIQALIFTATAYLLFSAMSRGEWKYSMMAGLSLLLTAGLLTRLDSAILAAVVIPAALYQLLKQKAGIQVKVAKELLLVIPLVAIISIWFAWKLSYYGDIVPNTYYAKVAAATSPIGGMWYLYSFFTEYWLGPFLLLGIVAACSRRNGQMSVILSMVVLWMLYVIKIGGDFMEYRVLVPVLPFIMLIVIWSIRWLAQNKAVQAALIVIVLAGSLLYSLRTSQSSLHTFTSLNAYDIESIQQLQGHLKDPASDWETIGELLGEAFDHSSQVKIAVLPAGAVPYYSRLPAVDMRGLNDKWIARYGEITGTMPGHQRKATLPYLLTQKVNLIVGQPTMVPLNAPLQDAPARLDSYKYFAVKTWSDLPAGSKFIAIPVNEGYKLLVLYIRPSPIIDQAIVDNGWETY